MSKKFSEGERVTYFPIKKNEEDNRHWPAEIVSVGPRYRVKILMPEGEVIRHVTAKRLARQSEINL